MTVTVPAAVLERALAQPEASAHVVKTADGWRTITWAEYGSEVRAAARALIAIGVEPRAAVAVLGFNRPEWVVFDVAAMAIGATPAGIYATSSEEEVAYITGHAEALVLLVENVEQWAKVAARRSELPLLRAVVTMRGTPTIDDPLVLSWEAFLARGEGVPEGDVDERLAALEPNQVASLIYTSGTTGPPKGAMITHDNLAWSAQAATSLLDLGPSDRTVSYLPLSHIVEQLFTIHGPAFSGLSVWFAQSIEMLQEDLQSARPTLFFGVPRVWEKLYEGVRARLAETKGSRRRLASWAIGVGLRWTAANNHRRKPGRQLTSQYRLARRLVFQRVKAALGLEATRLFFTGAAPIELEIQRFFAGLDVAIFDGYGQTEGTGVATLNSPGRARFGTSGRAFPGVDVRLADDGEVLVRGRNIFAGYLKEPAATAEVLADGWLYSGDLGAFDQEGFLTITGRKKELIITAGGQNISPSRFEGALKLHPLVSEVVVVGDRRPCPAALVALDPEASAAFLTARALAGPAHAEEAVRSALAEAVEAANQSFARADQIKRFAILDRQFTIEAGELTPTLKLKRQVIQEHLADEIERLYEGE